MFMARLMSTYLPEILAREMDLMATANPVLWMRMRRMFTGGDPAEAERFNERASAVMEDLLAHIGPMMSGIGIEAGQIRTQFFEGVERGKRHFVQYFENRVELLATSPEQSEPDDPSVVAAEFLRTLGLRPPQ